MNIRRMNEEDIVEASKIHQEVFSRQTQSEEWIRCNFSAFPRIRYFVADDGGFFIGYVQWIEKNGFRKEVILELEQIAVKPSRQKSGVGSSFDYSIFKVDSRRIKA